jgi:hypothetical protein
MNEIKKQAILLRVRDLISDKEMNTAQANLDLQRGGEWRGDYALVNMQIGIEIDKLLTQLTQNQ